MLVQLPVTQMPALLRPAPQVPVLRMPVQLLLVRQRLVKLRPVRRVHVQPVPVLHQLVKQLVMRRPAHLQPSLLWGGTSNRFRVAREGASIAVPPLLIPALVLVFVDQLVGADPWHHRPQF